jgi:two-component system chemotaxis response regulator CheB
MPRTAIQHVDVGYVLPATAIAPLLCREAGTPQQGDVAMGASHDDPQILGGKTDIARLSSMLGPPSGLTCPDCGGVLWQIEEGTKAKLVRFQCHVGHRYSPRSLTMQQDERIEGALWTAVRALEERADLRRRMADQTQAAGLAAVSEAFAEQAQMATQQANELRDLLSRSGGRAAMSAERATEDVPARRQRPRQQ